MKVKLIGFLQIVALSLVPTFLIWLPFYFNLNSFWNIPLPQNGMATIVANYDGPLFLVVAKTLYDPTLINQNFEFPLPDIYYSAHYPLYPLLIRVFSLALSFPYAMLAVTLLSSILALYFFKKFIADYVDEKNIIWMMFVFSIFPARWLIVRSVGSAEPLFIAAIIASVYYFKKEKYLFAGLWGVAAQLTKSPAIILFIAYFLAILIPRMKQKALSTIYEDIKKVNLIHTLPILLIPLSLVSIFAFYGVRYGDFFAYFNSGDNIHLFFPPFQIFNYSQTWVGTFWLEEVILVYLLGTLGFLNLLHKKDYKPAWFVGLFFASILFVSHRDIIRYALPVVPFMLAGWSDLIVKKEFKIAMGVIAIPIYLYSLTYISQNVMPISNWAPFL